MRYAVQCRNRAPMPGKFNAGWHMVREHSDVADADNDAAKRTYYAEHYGVTVEYRVMPERG